MEARLIRIRAKEKAQKERYLKGDERHKKRRIDAQVNVDDGDEDQFDLDDYDSEGGQNGSKNGNASGFSAATLELMSKLGMTVHLKDEDDEVADEMKVSYPFPSRSI